MNSANNPTADIASQILERENQERQALALLLDRHLARNDQLIVQKTQMGATEAFIGSVTLAGLRQISSPNKAQSSFISHEYVPIVVEPLDKTERHRCAKRL